MSSAARRLSVAVVGAGMAGAAIAHTLRSAGHAVHVFDKSRGPGGRMATRRFEWVGPLGASCSTPLDHGAISLTARSPRFRAFLDESLRAEALVEWKPHLAPGGVPIEETGPHYLPAPRWPDLCRHLLHGTAASWSCRIDGLHRGTQGWQLETQGERFGEAFDAAVLAVPPAQAAPLLAPHRSDWAEQAARVPMQSCWTLMGVARTPKPEPGWDVARPAEGALEWVLRSDTRPGRAPVSGQAHWVLHARPAWSLQHLERPAAWVQAQLQAEMDRWMGRPVDWLHSVVHRWRYARPPAPGPLPATPCWWDADQGLGACGDFFDSSGIEGAWLSAQALASAIRHA